MSDSTGRDSPVFRHTCCLKVYMSATGGEIPIDVCFHPDADLILVIWSWSWTWAESDVRSSMEAGLSDEERSGHQMERRRGLVREGDTWSGVNIG
jgi:hypothetical protein